ncbi:MAG: hypothetical protein H7X80_10765 [bacterium]|nr:hypothetical protein [Candidatus Kapabacteria bacterium]
MAIKGRTGWIILGGVFLVALTFAVIVAITFTRDAIVGVKSAIELPADLQPYESATSVRVLVTATDSVPADDVAADSLSIAAYIGSLDSSGEGVRHERVAQAAIDRDPTLRDDPLSKVGDVVKADIRKEAITRRAMVNYLNANGISVGRYRWMKLRALASAGITRGDADSAIYASNDGAQTSHSPSSVDRAIEAMDELFMNVDSIRSTVTASEIRYSLPHRRRILDNAVPDLEGVFPYF